MEIILNNNREIGDKFAPYFIAEVNTSHFGDIEKAKDLIDAVKKAGADCVKFQSWSTESLYSSDFYRENPMAKRFVKKFSLDEKDQKTLSEYCKSVNIDFASTPYSIDEANFLINKCKVPFIKVASMDINNYPYLRYLAKTETAIIISSGMANFDEISKAIKLLESEGAENVILLHCISIYPTIPEVASLLRIKFLKQLNDSVGFSDHSNPDTYSYDLSALSTTLGATWIERHFTILKKNATKDGVVSVNPTQLKELREAIDQPNKKIINYINKKYKKSDLLKILGSTNRELTNDEMLNRDYYQGRFASKTKSGKIAYNWDSSIKYSDITQI